MKCKAIAKRSGLRCSRSATVGAHCVHHAPSRIKLLAAKRAKAKAAKEKARLAQLYKYQDAIDMMFDRLRRMQLFGQAAKKAMKSKNPSAGIRAAAIEQRLMDERGRVVDWLKPKRRK